MIKSLRYLSYAACIALMTGCTGKNTANQDIPTISVSIEPLRQMTESLADGDYKVETVLDKGANPETYEPSMAQRASVDKSVAFLTVGAFPFENIIAGSLGQNVNVSDVTAGIKRIYGTHSHSDGHTHHNSDADPHTWTSARNAIAILSNIAAQLTELNPASRKKYYQRLDSMVCMIEKLDRDTSIKLTSAPSRSFAIWHPSLSYLARDYGLKQIAVGQENKEVSPRRMKEIIEQARQDSVRVFFFQKEFDTRQAANINDGLGSRMVTIDPLSYDWISQIELIADELAK